jgi:phasin family protein
MATRNDTTDKAADSGRDAAREAFRTVRTAADETANRSEQIARAGADLARRNAETARETFQSGLNTATETFERIADQFTQVLGFSGPQANELVRRSSEDVAAVNQAGAVLVRGAQEVSHEVLGLVQDRFTKNLEAMNRMVGCRSVPDLVAIQSDLARDHLQQVINTNRRVAEVSLRIADEASQVIRAPANAYTNQARRAS